MFRLSNYFVALAAVEFGPYHDGVFGCNFDGGLGSLTFDEVIDTQVSPIQKHLNSSKTFGFTAVAISYESTGMLQDVMLERIAKVLGRVPRSCGKVAECAKIDDGLIIVDTEEVDSVETKKILRKFLPAYPVVLVASNSESNSNSCSSSSVSEFEYPCFFIPLPNQDLRTKYVSFLLEELDKFGNLDTDSISHVTTNLTEYFSYGEICQLFRAASVEAGNSNNVGLRHLEKARNMIGNSSAWKGSSAKRPLSSTTSGAPGSKKKKAKKESSFVDTSEAGSNGFHEKSGRAYGTSYGEYRNPEDESFLFSFINDNLPESMRLPPTLWILLFCAIAAHFLATYVHSQTKGAAGRANRQKRIGGGNPYEMAKNLKMPPGMGIGEGMAGMPGTTGMNAGGMDVMSGMPGIGSMMAGISAGERSGMGGIGADDGIPSTSSTMPESMRAQQVRYQGWAGGMRLRNNGNNPTGSGGLPGVREGIHAQANASTDSNADGASTSNGVVSSIHSKESQASVHKESTGFRKTAKVDTAKFVSEESSTLSAGQATSSSSSTTTPNRSNDFTNGNSNFHADEQSNSDSRNRNEDDVPIMGSHYFGGNELMRRQFLGAMGNMSGFGAMGGGFGSNPGALSQAQSIFDEFVKNDRNAQLLGSEKADMEKMMSEKQQREYESQQREYNALSAEEKQEYYYAMLAEREQDECEEYQKYLSQNQKDYQQYIQMIQEESLREA